MKLARLNISSIESDFGETDVNHFHFKERCYFLVEDDYDFNGESATEITGLEATEWIDRFIDYGRVTTAVTAAEILKKQKKEKTNSINIKTGELIDEGYDFNGKRLSLSKNAQINVSGLMQVKDLLTYPITYNTINDDDELDIVDATDMQNMYFSALNTKKSHIDSGTALKASVRAASNKAEIDAVTDNR